MTAPISVSVMRPYLSMFVTIGTPFRTVRRAWSNHPRHKEGTVQRVSRPSEPSMSLVSAISLGVGAMVGAGIFALLGEAGALAGRLTVAAFAVGGVVALLAAYSYAKLGARYPSAGGVVEYLTQAFGSGVLAGGLSVFFFGALVIGTAMVAKAAGAYAADLLVGDATGVWANVFSTVIVVALAAVNIIGAKAVSSAERVIVAAKLTVLVIFAAVGLVTLQGSFLTTGAAPATSGLLASVGLTFFAYTGFGVIANTAEDMADPKRTLPRAIFIAVGLVIVLYLALTLAVFGNLSVADVIAAKETALAEAARPVFGQTGFTIMAIAAVLSTASAINANLYGMLNITYLLAKDGELPEPFERRVWRSGTEGLLLTTGLVLLLTNFLDLSAIAAVGSTATLLVYLAVQIGHLRLVDETGASRVVVGLGIVATAWVIGQFVLFTAQTNPARLGLVAVFAAVAFATEWILQRTTRRTIRPRTT